MKGEQIDYRLKGEYEIKVKAKDIFGAESEWSDPFEVTMPKLKYQMFIKIIEEKHPLLCNILSSIFNVTLRV